MSSDCAPARRPPEFNPDKSPSPLLPPPRKQAAVRPELFIQICSRGRRLRAHWPRRRFC